LIARESQASKNFSFIERDREALACVPVQRCS